MGGRLYKRKNMTVGDYDPSKWPRLSVGWSAMESALIEAGGDWVMREDLVQAGVDGSDLQPVTLRNMLSKMSAPDGPLERKGSVKNRRYRLKVE